MTGFIIALVLVFVIGFLLLSSLSVTLNINDKVFLKVSFLGICIFNINSKSNRKTSLKKKDKTPKDSIIDVLKQYASNKNNKELVLEIFSILKELCIKFYKILKRGLTIQPPYSKMIRLCGGIAQLVRVLA